MRYLLIVLMLSGCADMYGPIGQGLGAGAAVLSPDEAARQFSRQTGQPVYYPPPRPATPYYDIPQPKQVDYTCTSRCLNSGLQWGFCQSACSF